MIDWQQKRHPEDVPTPVAVAVSDFCRRARAPAPPATVRAALALLSQDDDEHVRRLADAEPAAQPLGPMAVVDIVAFGTAPGTAAQRQQSGYYEQVRAVAGEIREEKQLFAAEEPDATEGSAPLAAPPKAKSKAAAKPADKKPKRESLAARIAPHRRTHDATAHTRPPPPVFGTSFLPKRNLPAPRGRFTRIDSTRSPYDTLLRVEAKELIGTLVEQVPHRIALLRTLDQGYSGRKGAPLSLEDVMNVLDRHGLLQPLAHKERDLVLDAVKEARGALGKTAHGLGMKDAELTALIDALSLGGDVANVRERFTREALAPRNLALRLELLHRRRYLEDLGIATRFPQILERDLKKMIAAVRDAVHSVPELIELLAREHAIQPEPLRRALEELGLAQTFLTTP